MMDRRRAKSLNKKIEKAIANSKHFEERQRFSMSETKQSLVLWTIKHILLY